MDVVGGFPLADGTSAKALTGIDDHSRMCVCARLMARERTRAVCDGLRAALATYGAPEQILTDNGKVFTGRFNHPPVEVLFDRDLPRERDRASADPAAQPDHDGQDRAVPPQPARGIPQQHSQAFTNLKAAQQALDEWVDYYNTARPHQSLDMATPAQRFTAGAPPRPTFGVRTPATPTAPAMTGSAAGCAPTGSCACPGSRSASGATTPGRAAMSTSTASCCGSGSATNWSRPPPAPVAVRYETNEPSHQHRALTTTRVSRINRNRNVNHQPTLNRGTEDGVTWGVARSLHHGRWITRGGRRPGTTRELAGVYATNGLAMLPR